LEISDKGSGEGHEVLSSVPRLSRWKRDHSRKDLTTLLIAQATGSLEK